VPQSARHAIGKWKLRGDEHAKTRSHRRTRITSLVAACVRLQQSRRWLRPATALVLCSMMSSALHDVLTSALTWWQKPTVQGDLCCLTERPARG
jgi:hypothetical protein